MKKFFSVFLSIVMLAGATTLCSAADNSKKEAAALKSATSWLQLVDNGKYGKSWETAATLLKKAISKDKWEQAVKKARTPFGNLISRKVKSTKYTTTLPGAPDGQYVVIQYETSFANKKSAVEIITPMMDSDGNWRVSGYFVQ